MQTLADDALKRAAPSLANLDRLVTRWMNGLMLYLRRDLQMPDGHSIYIDSPWALTSVSQAQFWRDHLAWRIPGEVEGILSVDISDWDTPGRYVGKPAMVCTAEEIRQEEVAEMRDHAQRSADWERQLAQDTLARSVVDPCIRRPHPPNAPGNLLPLQTHTAVRGGLQ